MRRLILFLIVFFAGCRSEINFKIHNDTATLPLTGVNSAAGTIDFYIEKKLKVPIIKSLEITNVSWDFTAKANQQTTFTIGITDMGTANDENIYAKCSPSFLCSSLVSYKSPPPDYVLNAPVIISGSVNGEKAFTDISSADSANYVMGNGFNNGRLWLIVKVEATNPMEFFNASPLYINNLDGHFIAEKGMSAFLPLLDFAP